MKITDKTVVFSKGLGVAREPLLEVTKECKRCGRFYGIRIGHMDSAIIPTESEYLFKTYGYVRVRCIQSCGKLGRNHCRIFLAGGIKCQYHQKR